MFDSPFRMSTIHLSIYVEIKYFFLILGQKPESHRTKYHHDSVQARGRV